jgi:hypothetical protein
VSIFVRIQKYISARLVPWAFASGLILGFLFCCYWGEIASQTNPFPNFVRFYQALAPSSGYYPTVNQLIALCKSRVSKSDILVVVGGNSTFLGVAQPPEELWSRHLEENLGKSYAVVNLAQRGAAPAGAAESVAEALFKQGYQVIYVANVLPPNWGEPDGADIYAYMYWNARARSLLLPWEARDRYFSGDSKNRDFRKTLLLRSWLDRASNSEDLWNMFCYAQFCTSWDSLTRIEFWKPRTIFKDQEGPPLPVPERFAGDLHKMVEVIRNLTNESGATGSDPKVWEHARAQVEAGFVPSMRARTLIVVSSFSPYYVHHMAGDEQQRYATLLTRTAELYRASGVNAIESGGQFDDADYKDSVHMVPSGGRRLANELTPAVRNIARELYPH